MIPPTKPEAAAPAAAHADGGAVAGLPAPDPDADAADELDSGTDEADPPAPAGPAPRIEAARAIRTERPASAPAEPAEGEAPRSGRPAVPQPRGPVPDALREVWPAYFDSPDREDAPFLWALPRPEAELSAFLDCAIPGPEGPTWAGRLRAPIAHFRALEPEFGTRARIGHLLACVIVILRREPGSRRARRLFRRITAQYGPQAAAAMNLRWLTAVCDSFVDTGAEPLDRALGMSGTLLSNTLKLAETERRMFYPPRRWPPRAAFRSGGHMYDGVIAYWVGKGDMIENLVDRVERGLQVDSPAAPFVREVLERCFAENTVLRRMLLVQDGRSFPLVPEARLAAVRKAMEGL